MGVGEAPGPNSPSELAETFFAAINGGDAVAALGLWLEDAVFISTGGPPVEGRSAIGEVLRALTGNGARMSAGEVKTYVAGPTALRTGRLTLAGKPPGGEPFETVTDFVTVYALTPDGWRIALDAPAGLG